MSIKLLKQLVRLEEEQQLRKKLDNFLKDFATPCEVYNVKKR